VRPIWLLLIWLLALALAWPAGNFPLDDAWAYAKVAKQLHETGIYRVGDWPAMTLLTQVLWGTLFTKIFGFSFLVLRLSTLVLAVLGVLAMHDVLKGLGRPAWYRSLALALLLFNPIFFELSATFMTDIPFLSLALLSIWGYFQFMRRGRWPWWLLANLLALAAVLTRQLGLLLPLSFGVAMLLQRPNLRQLALAVGGFLMAYGGLQGYVVWMESRGGLPASFGRADGLLQALNWDYLKWVLADFSGLYFFTLGGFLLPAGLLLLPRRRSLWLKAAPLLLFCLWALYRVWEAPPMGNSMFDLALGTIAMPDVHRGVTDFQQLPGWAELGIRLLSAAGILLILLLGTERLGSLKNVLASWLKQAGARSLPPGTAFQLGLGFFLLGYGLFVLLNYFHFDRYLLPVLAISLLLLKPSPSPPAKWQWWAASLPLALMAAYAIAGTHDYFAWNRARWAAARHLMQQEVAPSAIDGGIEFNGWHGTGSRIPDYPYGKSWWFVADDAYMIGFAPYQNYERVRSFPYSKWLLPQKDSLHVFKRAAWESSDTLYYSMEPEAAPLDTLYPRFRPSHLSSYDEVAVRGERSYRMQEEFAFTHDFYPVEPRDRLLLKLWLNPWPDELHAVAAAPDAEAFYAQPPLIPTGQERGAWRGAYAEFRLPPGYPSDTLSVYLWKRTAEPVLLDELKLIWQRAQ